MWYCSMLLGVISALQNCLNFYADQFIRWDTLIWKNIFLYINIIVSVSQSTLGARISRSAKSNIYIISMDFIMPSLIYILHAPVRTIRWHTPTDWAGRGRDDNGHNIPGKTALSCGRSSFGPMPDLEDNRIGATFICLGGTRCEKCCRRRRRFRFALR